MSESNRQIGPSLPPNFKLDNSNFDDEEEDGSNTVKELSPNCNNNDSDDDDKSFGPALPPGFSGQIIGPSLDGSVSLDDEDDEDDETFGPVPEGQDDKNHQYDASQRLSKQNVKNITKREKWMLEPGKALAKTLQTKSVTQFSQKSKKDAPLTLNEKKELAMVAEKDEKMKEFLQKYEKVLLYIIFLIILCAFLILLYFKGNKKRDVSLLDQHRNDIKKNKVRLIVLCTLSFINSPHFL